MPEFLFGTFINQPCDNLAFATENSCENVWGGGGVLTSQPVGGRSWANELPCFVLNLFTPDPNLYLI